MTFLFFYKLFWILFFFFQQDLEEFVDGSGDDGFVVFTLGSMVDKIPADMTTAFLDAFKKIPQRVSKIRSWEPVVLRIPKKKQTLKCTLPNVQCVFISTYVLLSVFVSVTNLLIVYRLYIIKVTRCTIYICCLLLVWACFLDPLWRVEKPRLPTATNPLLWYPEEVHG